MIEGRSLAVAISNSCINPNKVANFTPLPGLHLRASMATRYRALSKRSPFFHILKANCSAGCSSIASPASLRRVGIDSTSSRSLSQGMLCSANPGV
ncbi:unnamed protein product [Linum trigynum]|uniref:Uncharacterized protein n=1 Tax=Linum trigynum TaxID=586398 RepID=A0AAV2E9K4_9ROSI